MIDPADPLLPSTGQRPQPVVRSVDEGILVLTVRDAAFGGSTVNTLFHEVAGWASALPAEERLMSVVDLTGTTFDPSGQELRAAAERIRAMRLKGRVALHVAGDFQYGLGRMLGILAEDSGVAIRPFKCAGEALDWARSGDQES